MSEYLTLYFEVVEDVVTFIPLVGYFKFGWSLFASKHDEVQLLTWNRVERWSELTYLRLSAATAWLHQTGANRCPDSSTECNNAQDKHNGKNGHFSTIVVIISLIITVIIVIVVGMISSELRNRNTVTYDDNSTQYSWGNRKPHEHTSLRNVIISNKQHSIHNKIRYLEGKINKQKSNLLERP